MKKMILWTIVLFTPLLWTTTAHALFGIPDVAALAQRVVIIANQGIQIANSVTQISRITEQMTEIKDQYDHLKKEALGHVGALTSPFIDLAALPGTFVSDGLAWRTDYAGTDTAGLIDAFDLFSASGASLTDYWRDRLDAAPVVTEADVIAEYHTLPVSLADRAAANYRRLRAEGEQATALSHTVNTAASSATTTVQSARASYAELRGQTNTSGTALQQAQVTGTITSGEVSASLLQLQAHEAARRAAEDLAAEQRRREREACRLETQRHARAMHNRRIAGIAGHRDGGASLLFRVN